MKAVISVELTIRLDEKTLEDLNLEIPPDYPVEWWEAEAMEKLNKLPVETLMHVLGQGFVKINDVYFEGLEK